MAKIQITGGGFQDAQGNALASGYLLFELSQDCEVTATGQICSGIVLTVPLDGSGNVSGTVNVWPNDQLSPVNNYYTVTGYTQNGQRAWGPNVQQVTGAGPFNLSSWVPSSLTNWTPTPVVVKLQTNEVANGSQLLLDLHAGTNISLTDNGSGQVTIATPTQIALETNGTPNASQSILNLQGSSNITILDNGSGNVSISGATGVPSFTTAGQGCFWGGQGLWPVGGGPINAGNASGAVYVIQTILLFQITVRKFTVDFQNSNLGNFWTGGLYDITGNTKLIDSGQISEASGGLKVVTLGSPVTLQPGMYWFAYGHSNPGMSLNSGYAVTNMGNIPLNANAQRFGTAANSLSSNNLPATLGAIGSWPGVNGIGTALFEA